MAKLRGALERVYREYRQQLFTCALAVTQCPQRAEDAVHEAFCRLLSMRRRPRRLKVYVFRSVRNAAVDELRRGQRTEVLNESFIFDRQAEPDEAATRSEFKGHVTEALLSLSQDERESIVQHLYCDLTFREIAQLRGVSINTISSWYYRGLNRLRGLLEA